MATEIKPFDPALLLTDQSIIAGALEDALNAPDPRMLPMVINDIARARGLSVAELAASAGLNRESLYRTLKGNTDAKWATVHALLRALGIRLTATA